MKKIMLLISMFCFSQCFASDGNERLELLAEYRDDLRSQSLTFSQWARQEEESVALKKVTCGVGGLGLSVASVYCLSQGEFRNAVACGASAGLCFVQLFYANERKNLLNNALSSPHA